MEGSTVFSADGKQFTVVDVAGTLVLGQEVDLTGATGVTGPIGPAGAQGPQGLMGQATVIKGDIGGGGFASWAAMIAANGENVGDGYIMQGTGLGEPTTNPPLQLGDFACTTAHSGSTVDTSSARRVRRVLVARRVRSGPQGIQGPVGPAGPQGFGVHAGAGAPAAGLGVDGDKYIDTTNGATYDKVAGAWVPDAAAGQLAGPQGPHGPPVRKVRVSPSPVRSRPQA